MGIYDRDYYREGPSFLGRWAAQGKVTLWLLGITVGCFVIQLLTKTPKADPFTDWLVLDVNKLFQGQVWRLLTYAFLHEVPANGLPWHIIGNMLFLWWFGRQVEQVLGAREFLLFYLTSAVIAGLAFTGIDVLVQMRTMGMLPYHSVLGASGAVMAVLVVAACYNPRQVIYLFFIIPVPIWLIVVLFLLIDAHGLLQLMSQGITNGVAVSAHLGGAAFGLLYYRFHWRLAGLFGWVRMPGQSRPRLRLYREDDVGFEPSRPAPPISPSLRLDDEHLEAQVDTILEKVSRVGVEGLTEQERQVLLRASEAIKRRRG